MGVQMDNMPSVLDGVLVETIKTKKDADATAHETVLTVDFNGATVDQLKSLAMRAIKVNVQAKFRNDDAAIPAQYTYRVVEYNSRGEPVTVESTMARAQSLQGDERKRFFMQMEAMIAAERAAAQSGPTEPPKNPEPTKPAPTKK